MDMMKECLHPKLSELSELLICLLLPAPLSCNPPHSRLAPFTALQQGQEHLKLESSKHHPADTNHRLPTRLLTALWDTQKQTAGFLLQLKACAALSKATTGFVAVMWSTQSGA